MTAKFVLQHIGYPIAGRPISPDEWKTYSTHDTESAAWKSYNRATDHLTWGQWDDHYRVMAPDGTICDREYYIIRTECARTLGRVRSERKAAAARINGTKGGRPAKN